MEQATLDICTLDKYMKTTCPVNKDAKISVRCQGLNEENDIHNAHDLRD